MIRIILRVIVRVEIFLNFVHDWRLFLLSYIWYEYGRSGRAIRNRDCGPISHSGRGVFYTLGIQYSRSGISCLSGKFRLISIFLSVALCHDTALLL